MGQKTSVTAADLFVLLDREFRRRRPRECETCFVQLPYRVDSREAGDATWELVLPPQCRNGCEALLQDLVSQYQELYDLAHGDRS